MIVENSSQPLVSAIVIFRDTAKFIEEAINSVIAQTYSHWELWLVDDGSTDGSTEIALSFAQRYAGRVHYLEHEGHQNRGMSATRNLGISRAQGKYVAFLDSDDVWLPEKLERQVAILESQPETGIVYGPTQYWHSWTGLPEDRERDHVPKLGVPLDTLVEPPKLLTLLHPLGQETAPCICSLLVRREVLERIGGFEETFHGFYEDQAFLTKVYLSEKVFVSAGCWDRYRIHPEQCCAKVKHAGQSDAYRKQFLEWFRRYLLSRAVTDSAIWKALDDAQQVQEPSSSNGESKWKWFLRVAEGNVARLVRSPDHPDLLRVDISRNKSEQRYDTQLNLPGLKVQANHRYILNFRARADGPRTISFGFAKGHSPWTTLGLYGEVALTTEWQRVEREFTVTEDEVDARILFDVGSSESSVELSAVTLLDPAVGRFVGQVRSPARTAGQAGPSRDLSEPNVPVNEVQFGSFRRLTPISRDFGCDRGRPIDRYYIENFLAKQEQDVRGRVLEIGENSYTRRFGRERVTQSDILHVVEGEPQATIIADLASADHIPSNSFDCIILTQTLQLIYDVRAALRTIRRILKPSGVLLATFPGISQTYDHEWSSTWYWNFTSVSACRLFEEAFSPENVAIEAFGNVLAAMSFLHGLSVDELSTDELDYREPGYDVTLAVRAIKPATEGSAATAVVTDQRRTVRGTNGTTTSARAVILMYHRIADGFCDPFSLSVAPERFAEQLEVLQKFATPMRLQEFVAALDKGGTPRPAAVITFDDGYADNLVNAKPLLERYNVPATVFLTTGYLGGQREFWWDELDRLLLQPGRLPQVLRMTVHGNDYDWNLGESAEYSVEQLQRDRTWTVLETPPSARHFVFSEVWRLFQFLPDDDRRLLLDELQRWAGIQPTVRATHRQLSTQEVVELTNGELVEVGAHTVTHAVLASLPLNQQREEIQQSKSRVEEIANRRVMSFAYPYGSPPDFTRETAAIVSEAGFNCACSTIAGVIDLRSRSV